MKTVRFTAIVSLLIVTLLGSGVVAFAEQPSEFGVSKGEEIDRGFVFWEGRYLEAPYMVDRVGLAVYINGTQVTEPLRWPPERKYCFDHDPGFPQGITQETTLEQALSIREPGGILFDTAKQWYLFTHLSYEEAYELTAEYYRTLPCVKSMYRDENGIWVLESYQGEKRRLSFGGSRMRMANEVYGPDGTGPPTREDYTGRVENRRLRFEERLQKGDCFLLFEGGTEVSMAERKAANLLPEMLAALRSPEFSAEEKEREMFSLGVIPRVDAERCRRFVANFQATSQLEARLNSLRAEIVETFGDGALREVERDSDLKARSAKDQKARSGGNKGRSGRATAHSPDDKLTYAWCGYTYDPEFDFDNEVDAVVDDIKDQDYEATATKFRDDHGQDGDCESCTYANLKRMKYADVLYYTCHGESSTGGNYLEMLLLETEAQVDAWSGDDPLVTPVEITSVTWPTGHPWAPTGTSVWPDNYWDDILTQSQAIVILSCCYSFENGWLAACGGGVGFGYNVVAHTPSVLTNNNELLERMNGTKDDGEHRKAGEAYDHMPAHLDEFRIVPEDADITLCPAFEEAFPGGDGVGASGTGHFQVDTYCHDTVPANEALVFATTGAVAITEVHWVGTDKVHRVEFDWSGTGQWGVTVTAVADNFHSWGAATPDYHRMDGNRVAPNGDNVIWWFAHCDPSAVEIASFSGAAWGSGVKIEWTTAAEAANAGFNLYRGLSEEGPYVQINDRLIPAMDARGEGASYAYTDRDVTRGLTYYYWLEDVDLDGTTAMHGPVFATVPSVVKPTPTVLNLAQNDPNPFVTSTMIGYGLPTACDVNLTIYNLMGQRVRTLVDEQQPAGYKVAHWDGRNENGVEVAGGVYYYRLDAGTRVQMKKMVLLK